MNNDAADEETRRAVQEGIALRMLVNLTELEPTGEITFQTVVDESGALLDVIATHVGGDLIGVSSYFLEEADLNERFFRRTKSVVTMCHLTGDIIGYNERIRGYIVRLRLEPGG